MAGLDTRGAFDGFTQGFGMMQNYKDSQDRKEYMKQQQGMQERGMEMREQEFEGQQQDRQKKNDQEYITQFYARTMPLMKDSSNPESMRQLVAMYEDPQAADTFKRNPMASMAHLLNPKTIAAVEYADQLGSGEGELFSEGTASAMNDYFSPVVNRMPGRRTNIKAVYPGQQEGTMTFDLGVVPIGEDGVEGEEYSSAMTGKRGTEADGDDEIMQVPIEQLIQKVHGAKQIYSAIGKENLGQFQEALRAMGYLPKEEARWEEVKGPGGSILQRNTVTGEMKNVLGRAPLPKASSNAEFAPSSDVKTIEYLISQGMTPEEARNEVVRLKRGSTGDGMTANDRFRVTYLTNRIKEIDDIIAATLPLPDEKAKLDKQRAQFAQQREALMGPASQPGLVDPPAGAQGGGGQQQKQSQQPSPITGKVYSDANGNKARWNGSEYVPVDAGGNR